MTGSGNGGPMRILSIGELIFDLLPAGEFIGGAPLNFAFHAARLGHTVAMATAVGADERGVEAVDFLSEAGIETRFVQSHPDSPTGVVRVILNPLGDPTYRLEHPAAYDHTNFGTAESAAVHSWDPHWIYYGTLFHRSPEALRSTLNIARACPLARRFYDVNLRPEHYHGELIRLLLQRANIVKFNHEEAGEIGGMLDIPMVSPAQFLRALTNRFGYEAVCLTLGARGCVIYAQGTYTECPATPVTVVDAVGAGDAFAAAFLHGWHSGAPLAEVGAFANRVGALVASRAGATQSWGLADLPH